MKKAALPAALFCFLLLGGCAAEHPPKPTQIWGGVGFSYEAQKSSGGQSRRTPSAATTHIGFEKQLGGGLGIGAEFAGTAD